MSEGVFLRHAEELASRAEYQAQLTPFLTPAEQRELYDALSAYRSHMVFWGGACGADRRRCIFFPDWLAECVRAAEADLGSISREGAFSSLREDFAKALCQCDGDLASAFCAVEIAGSGFVPLSHRDFLGGVMRLGLERETLGDIIPTSDFSCVMICTPNAAAVICDQLDRVGRDGVKVRLASEIPVIHRRFEEMSLVLSSMRLDCAVKALCNISRESAQRTILSGLCDLNYKTVDDTSRTVAPGDIISVRGVGKFRLGEISGSTKKDRIRLSAEKYI